MPASRALRRLLQVRHLEEEQARLSLENALSALHQHEKALTATEERRRLGRRLVASSARSGDLLDRITGLEESRSAACALEFLAHAVELARTQAKASRESFLSVRIERRQAETLIQEASQKESIVAARRAQMELDEWHRSRPRNRKDID